MRKVFKYVTILLAVVFLVSVTSLFNGAPNLNMELKPELMK